MNFRCVWQSCRASISKTTAPVEGVCVSPDRQHLHPAHHRATATPLSMVCQRQTFESGSRSFMSAPQQKTHLKMELHFYARMHILSTRPRSHVFTTLARSPSRDIIISALVHKIKCGRSPCSPVGRLASQLLCLICHLKTGSLS